MSRTTEKREVEIIRCDFCRREVKKVEKCVLCKKEGCDRKGAKGHFAFSVQIQNHVLGFPGSPGKICNECADSTKLTFGGKEISLRNFLGIISPSSTVN